MNTNLESIIPLLNKNLKIIGGKGTRYNPYRIENL